jgi:glutaminyl-tRNA synthetase
MHEKNTEEKEPIAVLNFIEEIIEQDLSTDKYQGRVHTRFPPEPNGFLHIGHAKSICLNFGLGQKYQGKTNLRFDDTNPTTEKDDYVTAIKHDIEWLGFKWNDIALFASDYFPKMHDYAVQLITLGKAYVDFSTTEEIAAQKGTPTQAGTGNKYRETDIATNLDLFARMRAGEFADGTCILRAKIDMASSNMIMRDPVIYRIKHAHHHRTGDTWCIYPMYDFAHCISDAIEGITHSICTLEFVPHRELYDWLLITLGTYRPQQIEFARLNLEYAVTSKRRLLRLVEGGHVTGWDDPRLYTISGLRRRGFTAQAIRDLATTVGISKRESLTEVALMEHCLREDLEKIAQRAMVVHQPLKVVIINYDEAQTEWLEAPNHEKNPDAGTRLMPFSREIFIEADDFSDNPPHKYNRLTPTQPTRLRNAYIISYEEAIKDADGNIIQLNCRYYPDSKSGSDTSGVKSKTAIHWVDAKNALPVELRLYEQLFALPSLNDVPEDKDFLDYLNPNSLTLHTAYAEPSLKNAKAGDKFQFMRKAFYCADPDSTPEKMVFNLTVGMKDSWAKINKK